MHLIRAGFDGVDISYPLTIGAEVAEKLENSRRIAELEKCDSQIIHNGLRMQVAGSGAPGGYAFRGDSGYGGPDGEIWFFKRPGSLMDPWGVRVSCRAYGLATRGVAATRARIEERFRKEKDKSTREKLLRILDKGVTQKAPELISIEPQIKQAAEERQKESQ